MAPLTECTLVDGDIAWMIVSTALVFLQSPACGLTQAGVIRRNNSLSMLMQSVSGVVIGSMLWFIVGYSLTFGGDHGGFIGDFRHAFLSDTVTCYPSAPTIPGVLFAAYQMMFASITPILCTGAWAEKLNFKAFIMFCVAFPFLVYYPVAHWLWGFGYLSQWGALDFAGGFVVHATSGVAAFAVSLVLDSRPQEDEYQAAHHNIPLTVIGGVLTWMAWFSFNGGSAFAANNVAAHAAMNTHISACASALTYLVLAYIRTDYFHLTEIVNGALAGLAGITGASGFVPHAAAFGIGCVVGIASYFSIIFMKKRLQLDDVLDVTSLQATPGLIGSILGIGLFASNQINPAVDPDEQGAIFNGSFVLLGKQAAAGAAVCAWTFVWTWVSMKVIIKIVPQPTHEEILHGLDRREHGITAYDDEHTSMPDRTFKLCEAAARGDLALVKTLIKRGANPSIGDYDGRTCLHLAAAEGHAHVLEYLVGLPSSNVNVVDRFGGTPLTDALRAGHQHVADMLAAHGAVAHSKRLGEELCKAGSEGDIEALKNLSRLGVALFTPDYDGRTALHLAAASGHVEVIKFLVSQGLDPHLRDRWGDTPIDDARRHSHPDIVTLLEEAALKVTENLCTAASSGDAELVKKLLAQGVDPNIANADGQTPLHLAAINGHHEVVEFLAQCADVNKVDRQGRTPLSEAVAHRQQKVAEVLRANGALEVVYTPGGDLGSSGGSSGMQTPVTLYTPRGGGGAGGGGSGDVLAPGYGSINLPVPGGRSRSRSAVNAVALGTFKEPLLLTLPDAPPPRMPKHAAPSQSHLHSQQHQPRPAALLQHQGSGDVEEDLESGYSNFSEGDAAASHLRIPTAPHQRFASRPSTPMHGGGGGLLVAGSPPHPRRDELFGMCAVNPAHQARAASTLLRRRALNTSQLGLPTSHTNDDTQPLLNTSSQSHL